MKYLKSINELIKNSQSLNWYFNKYLPILNSKLSKKLTRSNIISEKENPVY